MWLDLAFKIVNTAILVFLLYKVLKKPLVSFFKSRHDTIQTALVEARRTKAEGERLRRKYEERLQSLDQEMEEIRRTIVQEGEREKEKILKEAESTVAKIREQARMIAEQELKMTRLVLKQEMADQTVQLAEELLKEHLQPADQDRLVDDYIQRLGNSQ
jgi:F-type H+-transporting ATPase subunit b